MNDNLKPLHSEEELRKQEEPEKDLEDDVQPEKVKDDGGEETSNVVY